MTCAGVPSRLSPLKLLLLLEYGTCRTSGGARTTGVKSQSWVDDIRVQTGPLYWKAQAGSGAGFPGGGTVRTVLGTHPKLRLPPEEGCTELEASPWIQSQPHTA